MKDFTIRRAGPNDLDALQRVFVRAYAPARASLPDLPDVTGGLAGDIRDNTVLVAVRDRALVGGVVLDLSGPKALLANLAVDPDYGGHGLGRRLVSVAEDAARGSGATSLYLTTHRDLARTLSLYRRLGWIEIDRSGARVHLSKTL